jgi:DNA-binding MarR family transcriptional regulator
MVRPAADVAHVAVRLRASVSQLMRELRVGMPAQALGGAALGVLGQLYRRGPLSPTQLAQHEGVRLQTLTRLLAELEAAGHLSRRAHPTDGRQSLLALTARGAKLLSTEAQRREGSLAGVLGTQLDVDERATLLRACALLDRIADALGGTGDASAADVSTPEPAQAGPPQTPPRRATVGRRVA